MPDLIFVFTSKWKFIIGTSLLVALIALITSLASPKKYLSVATALPVNSALSDKGRIFNNNIEGLYSALGTTDDLDRIEGTAKLDTIFIAAVQENKLVEHYNIDNGNEANYRAVERLKKNSKISKSAYGELQVEVWDEDKNMAAAIANSLLKQLETIHRHLHEENTRVVFAKLKTAFNHEKLVDDIGVQVDDDSSQNILLKDDNLVQEYRRLINEYRLALEASPKALLTVEPARPSANPDKPRTAQMVTFSFAVAFACTFLLSLLITGKRKVA